MFEFAAVVGDADRLREFLVRHRQMQEAVPLRPAGNRAKTRGWERTKVKSKHRFGKSLVAGTWFGRAKLSTEIICRFCALWLTYPHPRTYFITRELSLSKKTVINWSSFCREVCIFWLEQRSEVLGGQDVVVEIDVAKIGHRKYNRGRWIDGIWVFGGFERGSGKTFLVPVSTRDLATLVYN